MNDGPDDHRPDDPDWDLLPHRPEAFFGLEEGFDRKDLKRRYNRFLKRFKPEKFPAEFQRIRSAYESLDEQLRYGERRGKPGTSSLRYEWIVPEEVPEPPPPIRRAQPRPDDPSRTDREESRTDPESSGDDPRSPGNPSERSSAEPRPGETRSIPPVPPSNRSGQRRSESSRADDPRPESSADRAPERPRAPLFERVRTESPEDLYEEIRGYERKQPYHFYALAVLSEVVKGPGGPFLKWLLAGLEAYPRDPALYGLLHASLRNGEPPRRTARVLEAISRAVPDDRFFSLTEPLWDRLLTNESFATFRDTLESCERNVRDHRLIGRLVFHVHILRRALFRANHEWLDERFAMLAEHLDELPSHLEYDYEFLEIMRAYVRHRSAFLANGHPLREEIDEVFADYCARDEFGGAQVFVAFQVRLVDRIDEVLRALPHDDAIELAPMFDAWKWIYFEVRERSGEDEDFEIGEPFVHSVYDMLVALEHDSSRTFLGRSWVVASWGYLVAVAFGYFLTFMVGMGLCLMVVGDNDLLVMGSILAAFGFSFFVGGMLLRTRVIAPVWTRVCGWFANTSYRRRWRRELVGFLRRTHAPAWVLQNVVEHLVQNVDELSESKATWIPEYLAGDIGLTVYSTALQFVR